MYKNKIHSRFQANCKNVFANVLERAIYMGFYGVHLHSVAIRRSAFYCVFAVGSGICTTILILFFLSYLLNYLRCSFTACL